MPIFTPSHPKTTRPAPRPAFEIGQPLDLLSVTELEERIAALRAEIAGLELARDAKRAATAAAESFFAGLTFTFICLW